VITTFDQPEAVAFREEIRGWLAEAVRPEWRELMFLPEEHPRMLELRREWDQLLWKAGYAGLAWPIHFGGRGLGPVEEVIFFEECAAVHAPQELNLLGFRLAGPAIAHYGTQEQKERHLPRILSGEEMWCEGFSEPNAGSDMASVSTVGRRLPGGGWHVQGQKTWTTFAPLADRCYLLTRTSDGPKRHNLSVFMLDMHSPGVEVRPIRQITGIAGFGEVFVDADVPDSDMLGADGDGWQLSSLVGAHRTAGAALGAVQRWSDLHILVDHLRDCARTGNVPAERVEDLADRVEVHRWQIRRVTELAVGDRSVGGPSAVLKLVWSQLAQALTQCGLDARCPEHESYWRDMHLDFRKLTIAGGTSQLQRNVIANRVLALPR
jgi:alkylation response protein AidB-like acyl-CoA dehydrogenase